MSKALSDLTDEESVGVGDILLTHAGDVAPLAGSDASTHAASFSPLKEAAQKAQETLIAAIATVNRAVAQREKLVAAALTAEKEIDTFYGALCTRLLGEVKENTDGAALLAALLCPDGSKAVTGLTGRPQLRKYQVLYQTMISSEVTSNPAYSVISAKLETFQAKLDAFTAAIQAKDSVAALLTAARAQRDAARAAWDVAFRDLIATAARIHGEDSPAFRAWIKPLTDLKAAQEAARTRKANAAEAPADPPAEVVTDPSAEG